MSKKILFQLKQPVQISLKLIYFFKCYQVYRFLKNKMLVLKSNAVILNIFKIYFSLNKT